ncbi:hypothetical protein Tco_0303760 [Tanacetum coccineum]
MNSSTIVSKSTLQISDDEKTVQLLEVMNELVTNISVMFPIIKLIVPVLTLTTTRRAKFVTLVKQIYHPQNHPTHYTHNSSTKSQQAATRNRGKVIVNSSTPTYDQEPTMVVEDDEMSKDKEIDKLMALISLGTRHVAKECQKPKRAKDAAYHKEKMLLCKQEEVGFQLNAEQADWRDDTNDEPEDQELEAHYMYMAQIQDVTPDAADNSGPIFDVEPLQKVQTNDDNYNVLAIENEHPKQSESVNDTYLEEQSDTNITIDSLDICNNGETINQDDDDLAKERDLLASLIEKLNVTLMTVKTTNQLMFKDLKKFQDELDRYHDVNYASKVEIDCAKAKGDLMSYKMESENFSKLEFLKKAQRANPRLYDIGCYNDNVALMLALEFDETIRLAKESRSKLSDLIKPFDYDQLNNLYDLFVPQREKSPEQQYFSKESKMSHTSAKNENSKESFNKQKTLLEKRMDESISRDQKCKSSKELFKIKRSVDTIFDEVERCKQTIAKRTYFGHIDPFIQNTIEGNFCPQIQRINADLEKFNLCLKEEMFLNEIDRLSREYYYADHMNAILGVYTELDEVTNLQYLKAQLQDKGIATSELKKLIEKMKGKSVETKFEKSSVIRQPNAFKSQRQSILGKPSTFSDSLAKTDFLKSKLVTTNNVSNDFSKPVTAQILPQNVMTILKNTNVIAPEMYKVHTKPNQTRTLQLPQDIRKTNKRVSFSTGVIPTISVSRPQLKSNQLEDRVMPNNSQGKNQEVEDHHRNFKFSNNKTSVTAFNDSLNAKTSNVNFVCVTCGKCVLNDNHDMCVLHYINGVNSRTKIPMAVPISTREHKRTVNQSVATPLKRTVASESTNQKPRHTTKKLYEHVSKTCSWWYPKFTPSGYKWKPKSLIGNVNTNVSMPLGNASRTANILEPMTPRCSTVSNTPLSSNSFAAHGDNSIHHRLLLLKAHDGKSQAPKVYYVEGLNHNLFSIGQLCDADLEVAFQKSTCYIRDLKGNDLLIGSRGTDLYSIYSQSNLLNG